MKTFELTKLSIKEGNSSSLPSGSSIKGNLYTLGNQQQVLMCLSIDQAIGLGGQNGILVMSGFSFTNLIKTSSVINWKKISDTEYEVETETSSYLLKEFECGT